MSIYVYICIYIFITVRGLCSYGKRWLIVNFHIPGYVKLYFDILMALACFFCFFLSDNIFLDIDIDNYLVILCAVINTSETN